MLTLHFITSGKMEITWVNLALGQPRKVPQRNIKNYLAEPDRILLEAKDMGYFTDWGIFELKPLQNGEDKFIKVSIDSDLWGWYGTAQILIVRDEEILFSDNFQSGTKGPLGNPKRTRSYKIEDMVHISQVLTDDSKSISNSP